MTTGGEQQLPDEQAHPRRRGWLRWRIAGPLAFAVAGLLFVTSAHVARGTDLRSGERSSIADVIQREQGHVTDLTERVKTLRAQVDDLTSTAAKRDSNLAAVKKRTDAVAAAAGMRPVTGQAVTVVLDDAPKPAPGEPLPDGLNIDSYVVHQQDVQAVVNALWAGGATGMRLMDQRVISTSAVRCVGTVLVLQGRTYPPPYKITAVGDPQKLLAALNSSPDIQNYLDYVAYIGLGYDVQVEPKVTLPAFQGSVDLRYARVPQ